MCLNTKVPDLYRNYNIIFFSERFFSLQDFDIFAQGKFFYFFTAYNNQFKSISMKQCFRLQLRLLICMLLISLAGYSQNNASSSSTPNPMPKLQSTGNAEIDRANHAKAVQAWKEKESKRLEQLRSNSVDAKNTSVKSNNVKSKSNKEVQMNSNPVISKDARIRETTIIDLPGYPKYISTGNTSLDEKNYQNAKADWINSNPAVYNKYLSEHSNGSGKLKRNQSNSTK